MAVKTFQPRASIVLKKNIGRSNIGDDIAASERFRGSAREIDLLPFLGEEGSVVVSKSIREPAGMFSITLVDRMVAEQEESLAGLIEPMDVIEIRMARSTGDYAGTVEKSMPMMMRGLVSSVQRTSVMTNAGAKRAVIITGQDYGKILQIMQVKYIPGYVLGQSLLTSFNLVLNYGTGSKAYDSAGDFVVSVIGDVVNPFLAKMREAAVGGNEDFRSPVLDLGAEAQRFGGGVFPYGVNQWPGGAIYDLMAYFGDVGPWAELFVEDREAGPVVVYRPTPFKDLGGAYIQAMDIEPLTIKVFDDAIISVDTTRTDSNVANFFWVGAARYTLINGALLQAAAAQEGATGPSAPFQGKYPNSSAELYGFRYLEAQSQQGPRVDGQPEANQMDDTTLGVAMIGEKRRALIDANKDNVVLESGVVRMRGDERVKPGRYVRLIRGTTVEEGEASGLAADHYAYQVTHEYSFSGFLTTFQFDRGTGFVERVKRERGVNSPYLSELSLGGAYDGR